MKDNFVGKEVQHKPTNNGVFLQAPQPAVQEAPKYTLTKVTHDDQYKSPKKQSHEVIKETSSRK